MSPDISEYLQAEYKFGLLWEDIIKILNDAVDANIDYFENKQHMLVDFSRL